MDRMAELDQMIQSGYGNTPQGELPEDWESRTLNPARIPCFATREERFRWMRVRQAAKPGGQLKGRYNTCK